MKTSIYRSIFILLSASIAQISVSQENKTDSVIQLNEVTVSASIPQVKKDGTVTTVRVRGTMLSKMGNASNMLANTPGLHKGASGIEVNGLGKPIFILNDREIDAEKVLDLLQANTIKEIRINKAPDIRYSADGRPTVEIVLFRPLDDYISFSIGDDMAARRKYSNAGNLNFGIQSKKIVSTLDYMGGVVQFQNKETYFRNIYREYSTSVFNQKRTASVKELPQRIRLALDYNINKNNRFGVEYYYQFNKRTNNETGIDYYETDKIKSEEDIARHQDKLSNLHNISLQYNYKGKINSVQLVQDYATNTTSGNVLSNDGYGISSINTYSKNKYDIATSNIRFNTRLPFKISMASGIKYIYVNNKSNTWSDHTAIIESKYNLSSDIEEHNPQIYISLSRKIKRVTINAGVRYNYLHRDIINRGISGTGEKYSQHISSFFPLLSLTYKSSNGSSFYIRYNRSVEQPNFSALNSGLTYLDSLTYTIGNPDLKATFTDALTAGINWHDFSFTARYTHVSDPIVNVSETLADNSDVITEKYINLKANNKLSLSASYSKTFSKLNMYAEGALVIPHGKYTFMNKEHVANTVSFNANFNLSYRITSSLGIFTSFNYQGYNEDLTLSQKAVNNLSVGLVASLFNNRLMINAAFSDLLNGAHYNNLTYRYGNVSNGTFGTNDQRGFLLKLNYALFSKKIKSKTSRKNDDTIQRIY